MGLKVIGVDEEVAEDCQWTHEAGRCRWMAEQLGFGVFLFSVEE